MEDYERHDQLFRRTFESAENAAVELRYLLPERISERIEWETLQVESGTLLLSETHRGKGKRLECDMLYSARLSGKQTYFYILFEHQSTFDALMPYRLLSYMVGIWGRWLSESKGGIPLPVIIPAVVHHSETGWTAAAHTCTLFDPELIAVAEIRNLLPQMHFLLDDISHIENDILLARAHSTAEKIVPLALWALRDGRNAKRFRTHFQAWFQRAHEVHQLGIAPQLLSDVFWYIGLAESGISYQDLREAVQAAPAPTEGSLMNLVEQIRQQGRQEGRQEAQMEGLVRLLQLKFGELSDEAAQKVATASFNELERYLERVLTAASLDEVFQ